MEKDQIAILKNSRLIRSSKGYVLWKSGTGLIATKTNFEDLYIVNTLENNVLHCSISSAEIIILEWVNKWKRLR